MAANANTIIARAKIAFPDMGATIGLGLLNDTHAEFLSRYPLRQDVLTVALTANTQRFTLEETAIQIEAAYYFADGNAAGAKQIDELIEHELDVMREGWREHDAGVPDGYYIGGSLTAGQIGFYPKPDASTLAISAATNTSPIEITTASAHGLSGGEPVIPFGVGTNTNANTRGYADVTSTTTFDLYSDSSLTTPVAGNGVGVGGYLICTGSPAVQLHIKRNQTLTGNDTIPSCLLTIEPYVYSICRRHAELTLEPQEWQKWQRLEEQAVHKMELYLANRAGEKGAVIKPAWLNHRRTI
jgi:hypothetical protein